MGYITINGGIINATTLLDRAYINFEEGNAIDKFMLNPDATKLYIPQGGKDYAIASVGGDGVHTVYRDARQFQGLGKRHLYDYSQYRPCGNVVFAPH